MKKLKNTHLLFIQRPNQQLMKRNHSRFTPPGLGMSSLYLRTDRTLLVLFGEKITQSAQTSSALTLIHPLVN